MMSMKTALKAWHKILDELDAETLTEDQAEGLKVMVASTGAWGDPMLRWKALETLAMYNTVMTNRLEALKKVQAEEDAADGFAFTFITPPNP